MLDENQSNKQYNDNRRVFTLGTPAEISFYVQSILLIISIILVGYIIYSARNSGAAMLVASIIIAFIVALLTVFRFWFNITRLTKTISVQGTRLSVGTYFKTKSIDLATLQYKIPVFTVYGIGSGRYYGASHRSRMYYQYGLRLIDVFGNKLLLDLRTFSYEDKLALLKILKTSIENTPLKIPNTKNSQWRLSSRNPDGIRSNYASVFWSWFRYNVGNQEVKELLPKDN